jgi:predicted permease
VANLFLLLLCFGIGMSARRARVLPDDSHRAFNAWVLRVSLPALVFRSLHGVQLDGSIVLGSSLLWLVLAVPAATALWLWKRSSADPRSLGALALCGGLGNTAFLGLPLIETIVGPFALASAAVIDQLGSFLALFFLAMPFATFLQGGTVSIARQLTRLVTAPAFVALVLALSLRGVAMPEAVSSVLGRLADMLSPLALASIGFQLEVSALRGHGRRVVAGLAWKMVLAPLMVWLILWLTHQELGVVQRIVVLQAAMPPMVTAGVVAADHHLNPSLAAALIAVGVPLSFITVPLWWWAIN